MSYKHICLWAHVLLSDLVGWCAGPDGVDGYEPDDALDPDQMTYEVRIIMQSPLLQMAELVQ